MSHRFFAAIHSITGDAMMIKPRAESMIFEPAHVSDFVSIIPNGQPDMFCFHVQPSRLPLYAAWLSQPPKANPVPAAAVNESARRPMPVVSADEVGNKNWDAILRDTDLALSTES